MTAEINQLKVSSYVWLANYKQFKRAVYLNYAIAYTREALRLSRKG